MRRGHTYTAKCNLCGEIFSYVYHGYIRVRCNNCARHKRGIARFQSKHHESHIDEISKAARDAGMSYGKYRAMIEGRYCYDRSRDGAGANRDVL